jgi:hypothetical protein
MTFRIDDSRSVTCFGVSFDAGVAGEIFECHSASAA